MWEFICTVKGDLHVSSYYTAVLHLPLQCFALINKQGVRSIRHLSCPLMPMVSPFGSWSNLICFKLIHLCSWLSRSILIGDDRKHNFDSDSGRSCKCCWYNFSLRSIKFNALNTAGIFSLFFFFFTNSIIVLHFQNPTTCYQVAHYAEEIIRNVHSAKETSCVLWGFLFVARVTFSADFLVPVFRVHPKTIAHTSNTQREEEGGAGSRMFSSEYGSLLHSRWAV